MAFVRVYTTPYCGYCSRAIRLLRQRGIDFEEIDVSGDGEKRRWLLQVTGRRTVPQIFFGDVSIGCDELHALDRAGKLPPKEP